MRDYQRKPTQRSKITLRRGADGSLRAAASESDIADIWAEQQRIKLAEAIQADQRRAEAKKQGWRRHFKKRAIAKKTPGDDKEVVVTISLPKLKKPKAPAAITHIFAGVPKKRLFIGGSVLGAFLLLTFVGPFFYGKKSDEQAKKSAGTSTVLNSNSQIPQYETILPEGETIEDLGGWKRVSPPNTEAVFAYKDTLTGVPIIVSEQPLPSNFKKDPAGEVAKMAGQFGANEKVTAEDLTIHIGTSIKGPQSVVFTKRGVLMLIRSEAKIESQSWIEYVQALR